MGLQTTPLAYTSLPASIAGEASFKTPCTNGDESEGQSEASRIKNEGVWHHVNDICREWYEGPVTNKVLQIFKCSTSF